MTAAEILREHRLRSGLTQREVAKLIGVPRQRVTEWEAGHHEPGFETVERILAALGQTITTIEAGEHS